MTTFPLPLAELLGHLGHPHTLSDRIGTGVLNGTRIKIRELGTRFLEAVGGGIGDVVAGHFQIGGSRVKSTEGDIERHVGFSA